VADALFSSEFRQVCSQRGCPFCSLARARTRRYLSNLLYEFTLAGDIHRRLAESRGFCNGHAWLLQHVAHLEQKDGTSVAIFYATVVQHVVARLGDALDRGWPRREGRLHGKRLAGTVLSRLRPTRPCLVCERQRESECFTLTQFLDEIEMSGVECPLAQAYARSAGACLPHLDALLAAEPGDGVARWLVDQQRAHLMELASHLETYVRKHDAQCRREPMGPERDSWVRVIEQCVGKPGVPMGLFADAAPAKGDLR